MRKNGVAIWRGAMVTLSIGAGVGASAAADMGSMASDPKFDSKFAEEMLADHKKDIASVTDARDHTPDAKLKKLLDGLVPTLQKHEDTAQKIIDSEAKK
jgi:predicted outer membrane protein